MILGLVLRVERAYLHKCSYFISHNVECDIYTVGRMSCEEPRSLKSSLIFLVITGINFRKLVLIRALNNNRWHNCKEQIDTCNPIVAGEKCHRPDV